VLLLKPKYDFYVISSRVYWGEDANGICFSGLCQRGILMKKALFLVALFVTSVVAVPAAMAQADTQQVYLHFDKAVAIPGQVLQAGTYLFVPMEDNRNIVRVYDVHRTKLFATLETIPATEVGHTSDKLQVSIGKLQDGTPALVDVYYPGGMDGYELMYSHKQEKQLSASQKDVISTPDSSLASGD
jgi:hypothetical protein